jgi:L-lactate dehydrogenase complex protein LldG
MASRETILQRIRSGLNESGRAAAFAPAAPPPVHSVWPRENPDPQTMAERFTAELREVHGEVIRCPSMEDACRQLAELMQQAAWAQLGAIDAPLCRELTTALPDNRVRWVGAEWSANEIAQLSVGLVAPVRLLADTGSCVFACGTAHERLMCYLPPVCIVIARVEQLTEHMPAAWDDIAARCADPAARGEIVIVTGPSRTADIEKILILGVHGPQRLVVLLVG